MQKQCRYFAYVYMAFIFTGILLSFDHALAQPWNERASGADSFSALGAEAYQAAVLLGTRATAPASTTASASDSNSVSDSASDPNSISDSASGTNSHVHWDPHGPPGGAAGPRRLQQADTSGAEAAPSSPGASDQGAPPPPLLVPLLPYGLSNQVLALKEALALAAVMNWTVASFGFWPHSSEVAAAEKAAAAAGAAGGGGAGVGGAGGGGGGVAGAGPGALAAAAALAPIIPFDLVFSRESLAPVVRVLGWEEAVATQQQQQRVAADSSSSGSSRGSSSGSSRGSSSSSTGAEPPLQVEGVVSLSPLSGFSNTLSKASASGFVAVPKSAKTLRNHGFKCDAKGLQWLRNALAGGRRSSSGSSRSDSDSSSSGRSSSSEGSSSSAGGISWSRSAALFSYRRVVPPARSSYRPFANDTSPCARAFHQVTLRLARSDLVAATARDFVAAALLGSGGSGGGGGAGGGGDGTAASEGSSTALEAADASAAVRPPPPIAPYYVALHVRPYPDSCMDYFVNMTTFDLAAAKKVCRNPRLLAQMVPLVRQRIAAQAAVAAAAVAAAGAGANAGGGGAGPSGTAGVGLFVMSHPRVRDVVRRELRRLWAAAAAAAAAAADPASDGAGSSRRRLAGAGRPRGVGATNALAAAAAAGDGGAGYGEGGAEAGDEPAAAGAEQPQTHDQPHYQAALPLPRLFFIDVADLPGELRHHLASTSILSLVEQQVCAGADAFIGTASSSISVMVAQERTAADWEASARGEPSGRVTVLL